jgi:hypothetical protein
MFLGPKFWRFFFLTAIRTLSLAGLILAFAATIFTTVEDGRAIHSFTGEGDNFSTSSNSTSTSELDYLPNSTVPQQPAGAFWAIVNHGLVMFQLIVLFIAEIGLEWTTKKFNIYFPVLGDGFGLGPLGIFQALLGATILSHHVNTFTLVASWFLTVMGFINMLLGLIFREKIHEKRSWSLRDRARDVVPSVNIAGVRVDPLDAAERAAQVFKEKPWAPRHDEHDSTEGAKAELPILGWANPANKPRPFLQRSVQSPPLSFNGRP